MTSCGIRPLAPPRPPITQKPGLHEHITAAFRSPVSPSVRLQGGVTVPQQNPLPSVSALGACPAKPRRPPHVNCDVFRRNVSNATDSLPLPPAHLSINSVTPPPPADFTFPAPPPPMELLLDEDYDDVDFMNTSQSSLGKSSNDLQESSEETYEDIDSSWPEKNKVPNDKMKTKEVTKKDEKKRLEQEKKEKKVQKREQEARKKFKIKGPIVVVTTVKAKVDHKGGKNKLPMKQGETVEIVRQTGNPKNYWLARNREAHYGFVKPDTVDECAVMHTKNSLGADNELCLPAVTALESDVDVYESPEDSQMDFCFPPPPPQDDLEFNSEVGEMYNNVSSTDLPPPPAPECIPKFRSTSKMNEICLKKTFEKEEKDFRKKFKYNGEIRVLYQATVLPSLTIKKFGNKDLMVKPGEIIDVIVCPAGDKLIGRNSEGKFGYVSAANIEQDSSVYDDVGEECIYDND